MKIFKLSALAILALSSFSQPTFAAYNPETFKLAADKVNRTQIERFLDNNNVKEYGAKCDGKELLDVTTTSGSANISSASYSFVAADVGKKVYLYGSVDEGTNTGKKLVASEVTISSVNAGVATLSAAATASVTGVARLVMYTTNDTAAIQAAIDATDPAYTGREGGIVEFPSGICVASTLTLKRQVILEGKGRQNSFLLQIGGTNGHFIKSENFDTLTGTGANYGTDPLVPSWFGLKDISIDGNRVYQTAGNCVSFYGNGQVWQRTLVKNCNKVGMYTEAAGTYSYNPTDWRAAEEGFFDDLIVRQTGSHGWQMRGPHDSQVTYFLAYEWNYDNVANTYGFINEASGSLYSGGAHYGEIHPYTSRGTNKTNVYIGASSDIQFLYSDLGTTTIAAPVTIDNMSILGCGYGGTTPCLDFTTAGDYAAIDRINGSWYWSSLGTNLTMINVPSGADGIRLGISTAATGSTTASNTILKVRGAFGKYSGIVSNMTGTSNVCLDAGGTYNSFDFSSFSCTTHTSYTAGNHNIFNLRNYVTGAQTAFSGTLNSTDIINKLDTNEANYTNVVRGSAAIPALTFGGVLTSGFYGDANGYAHYSIGGTEVAKINNTGITAQAGTVDVGVAGTTLGKVTLNGNTSGTVTVQPAAAAGTWGMTLPTSAGTAGHALLTDGAGVTSWGTVTPMLTVTAKTSNYTLTTAESGGVFTNNGATGPVTLTLPVNATGAEFIIVSKAAYPLILAANTGQTIRSGSSVTASAGNLTSDSTAGGVLRVVAISATEWYVTSILKSWTVN